GARASSVFLHDEETDELVFEAVAGEGAGELIGKRFPSSTGVAGWVLVTRQPLVIEELEQDPRFAREAAESTGFVPNGLMAVPLLHEERALDLLQRAREARAVLEEEDGQAAALARLAARLADAEPEQREAAQRLLESLD